MTHLEVNGPGSPAQFTKTQYVPFGDRYVLHPRSFVLGITGSGSVSAEPCCVSGWAIKLGQTGPDHSHGGRRASGVLRLPCIELSNVGEIAMTIRARHGNLPAFPPQCQRFGKFEVNPSQFVGMRKPVVGKIKPDDFARMLGGVNS